MMAESTEYKIRANLVGHKADVRCACVAPGGDIVTGSRDGTCIIWNQDAKQYQLEDHSKYIMTCCQVPASERFPEGLVVTGSLDSTACVYDLRTPQAPILRLIGHDNAVSSIAVTNSGLIVTGSWDGTAKVWADGECVATLKGHELSVLAVATRLTDDGILTASGDKTIRLWENFGTTKTFLGHTDVVRALAVVSDSFFLSAANDSNILLWDFDGNILNTMSGHSSFIYSLALLPGDAMKFVSSGEDGCVKVWEGQNCVQTIALPCISVWSVAANVQGDIIVGCDDGIARIFTCDPNRVGSSDVVAQFEEQVSATLAAKADKVGDLSKSSLPGMEALNQPGKKDNDQKLINNSGKVECYLWSQSEQKWECAGEVTDAINNSSESDFVFNVELDGKQWQIKHNKKDNPYLSAHRFLQQNEMSLIYQEEIAQFIIKNAGPTTLSMEQPQGSGDPFTGAGAYIPGSRSAGVGGGGDPFTGTGAYIPGGAAPSRPTQKPNASQDFVPTNEYVLFQSAAVEGITKKLVEFNSKVDASLQLPPLQLTSLTTALPKLLDRSSFASPAVALLLNVIEKVLKWPRQHLFPGLDVLRLAILHSDVQNAVFSEHPTHRGPIITRATLLPFVLDVCGKPEAVPTRLLAFRVVANAFSIPGLITPFRDQAIAVIEHIDVGTVTSSIAMTIATVMLNMSYFLRKHNEDDATIETELACLQAVMRLCILRLSDGEAAYRILMGIGNMISQSEAMKGVAKDFQGLPDAVQHYRSHSLPKVAQLARTIQNLLKP